jgi:hypothetical protein
MTIKLRRKVEARSISTISLSRRPAIRRIAVIIMIEYRVVQYQPVVSLTCPSVGTRGLDRKR